MLSVHQPTSKLWARSASRTAAGSRAKAAPALHIGPLHGGRCAPQHTPLGRLHVGLHALAAATAACEYYKDPYQASKTMPTKMPRTVAKPMCARKRPKHFVILAMALTRPVPTNVRLNLVSKPKMNPLVAGQMHNVAR